MFIWLNKWNTIFLGFLIHSVTTTKFKLEPAITIFQAQKTNELATSDMQFNQNLMPILKYNMHTDLVKHSVLYHYIHASHPVPNSNQINYPPFSNISKRSLFAPLNAHSHTYATTAFKTNNLFY